MNTKDLLEKVSNFKVLGKPSNVEVLESGHINKTYKIICKSLEKNEEYILQYINTEVFLNLSELMINIKKITTYIRNKAKENNEDLDKITITIIDTIDDNKDSIYDKNWRMQKFITNTKTFLTTKDTEILYEAGKAVGSFQKYLDGFNTEELYEIIPKFHNTPNRVNNLENALNNGKNRKERYDRFKAAEESISFLLDKNRIERADIIVKKLENGELPYRVTHNDTKLSNILFDKKTNKAVCLIDLDTVMPGTLLYDFGEGIRTSISTAREDEEELGKVNIELKRFEAFTKGFLENVEDIITKSEKENLLLGVWMMVYENAVRFITDFLNGDIYFNVKKEIENHNLVRAKVQIELLKQIEKNERKMEEIIEKYTIL